MNANQIEVLRQVMWGERDDVFFSNLDDRQVRFISSHGCSHCTQEEFIEKHRRAIQRGLEALDDITHEEDPERFERGRRFLAKVW